ncbi:hypothetical protein EC957_010996 [Mortierella hygrophila]|uniref:Uncharacterized protein n=1 Tax=Mortierella hygrophila TaxID=979708 RepID=A0A9P6EWC2_9FUNG|nr:hypothetical protein EC957_010996 [Mortierella hygrophila]
MEDGESNRIDPGTSSTLPSKVPKDKAKKPAKDLKAAFDRELSSHGSHKGARREQHYFVQLVSIPRNVEELKPY